MIYKYKDSVIQVFCKAPIAGQVKTRLMIELTAHQAMQVHSDLTQRLLTLLNDAKLCPVQLWCSPSVEFAFFQQMVKKYSLTLHQQTEGLLGKKMGDALNFGLQHFKHVLLVGCDCPSLSAEDFNEAILALKHHADVVLAPTEDGGYSLIGVNQAQPILLSDVNMPWSTSQVLAITRRRVLQQQLKLHELAEQWDVDTPEDLQRYWTIKA